MAASSISRINPKTLSVGIIGYTGASGKALATECLKNDIFKSTVLIGRRNVKYDQDYYNKAIQKVIDFDKINDYDDVFKGLDVVYCCLGTTRAQSGRDGFRKIEYDYVVNSAQMAKKNGVRQFHLVSSGGADQNSFIWYLKIKGESEAMVNSLGFEKSVVYRPRILLAKRDELRFNERALQILTMPFQIITPKFLTTPIETLAKSMIENTINREFREGDQQIAEIIENDRIFELAKCYDNNKS